MAIDSQEISTHSLLDMGRGLEIYDRPVTLEPLLPSRRPIDRRYTHPVIDDGRHPGFLGWFEKRSAKLPHRPRLTKLSDVRPSEFAGCKMTELQIRLPKASIVIPEMSERLLLNLANRSCPTSLEIIGLPEEITVQIAVRANDVSQAEQHIKSHFPESSVSITSEYLALVFRSIAPKFPRIPSVIDFGLRRQMLRPLNAFRSYEPDPLIGLFSALSTLRAGESCVYQVLFQSVREDWRTRFIEELIDGSGNPRFLESKDLLASANEKFLRPLLSVSVRVLICAADRDRVLQVARGMVGTFQCGSSPNRNEIVAIANRSISASDQFRAFLNRTTYRSGILLNGAELAGLAHLPSASVKSSKLKRDDLRTKSAPGMTTGHPLCLGQNVHQGAVREVTLSNEQRSRHIHLIGSSGSGKSTLLLSLIRQDLEESRGVCVIDPHGDLIDSVVRNMPDGRLQDVILLDPSDSEYPIGFNILQANSLLEKNLLSSDLVATFRRMSTSWGDVMDSVLANAILAFVESSRGGTLFELKRFLVEKDFRDQFLESVTDEGVAYFWREEFPLLAGKPQASILIRLDAFLRQSLIRNIVCQKDNRLNFREIMDSKKVLLIKLSQGLIGEENAYLLGTMIVSRLYQAALSRQNTQERPHFWLYMDEFHHFITPSMERILAGTRKYNLGLTLAHQDFRQMHARSQEVASSVLSNCYTRICFRLGDADSEKFASGFSYFDARALQNLGIGEAIARVERADYDFNLSVEPVPAVAQEIAKLRTQTVMENSRSLFSRSRLQVEEEISVSRTSTTPIKTRNEVARKRVVSRLVEPPAAEEPKTNGSAPINADPDQGEHRYLQTIIKRVGEEFGFISTIEKSVFGGLGKVDVALERKGIRIACEVANTNTKEYETQNIQKCLASGFDSVIVVSTNLRHLENIQKRAELVLSPVHYAKVFFVEAENIHLLLESIVVRSSESDEPNRVKGFMVRSSAEHSSSEEAAAKRKVITDVVGRIIRRRMKG